MRVYKIVILTTLVGLTCYAASYFLSTQKSNESFSVNIEEEGEENEEQKRINTEERWKAEFEMIKNPITGEIPKGIRAKELNAAFRVSQFELDADNYASRVLPAVAITGRGPNNYGGRTRALGFDTRNTDIVISGGVTSGIYRSTNSGASWTRVTPAGEIHSLTCVAQDTRVGHQDTWYASTGERSSSAGGPGSLDDYYGYGIYKSTDNGVTWAAIANTQSSLEVFNSQFDYIHRLVVDPNNGNVLAATANIVSRLDISTGTWSIVLGNLTNNKYVDIIYNPIGNKFYAAIDGQDGHAGIYSSTDGITWSSVGTTADLNPAGDPGFGYDVERIVLANVANTEDVIAFFQLTTNYGFTCTNGASTNAGLAFYDVSANSWTIHTDKIGSCSNSYTTATALPKQIESQEGYNMAITTKPNDANIVYLGGTESYRYNLSTNLYEFIGGSQKAANAVNLHVDNHIFMFEPGSNDMLWSGNDGGLRKTNATTSPITATAGNHDNGFTWTDRNTDYNGYQYYGIDIDPATGSNFIAAGAQDNAFTIQPTGATALEVGPTADGVDVAVISGGSDFTTHNIFLMWQNGSMLRYENGSEATGTINPAATGFVGRFYLDADNTNYMYFPSNTGTLHRTRIAESIAATTTTGNSSTGWEIMTGIGSAVGSNEISAMDASRDIQYSNADYSASDANRKLYIGTKNGNVFRLDDPAFAAAATAPVNIKPTGASTGFVSDIAVNPLNDKEILVTYSNYGVNSVYHTSDASVASPTWTNVEGPANSAVQLASARCAMITVENGVTIYMVGTSTGLYATDALSGATTSWTRLGTNTDLGLAVCVEMRLRPADNILVLGTHGNGAFTLKFPTPLPVELVSFTGKAIDKGNQLNWETANEFNNKGFDVQKSNNGKDFENIGFIEGNGTSTTTHNYELLDEFVQRGTSYYRLKQIDFDENFQFSEVITIDNQVIDDARQVKIYPNPVVDYITIENVEGTVTIHNTAGVLVKQFTITDDKERINLSSLSKGTYLLRFETANGKSFTRKIVK